MSRPRTASLLVLALAALLVPTAQATTPLPLPLEPAQVEAMALAFAPAVDAAWIPVARIPAEVELASDAQFALVAPYPGTLAAVLAQEGRDVVRGTPLLSIASPAWAAALADAAGRSARRDVASRQAVRGQALLEAGVIAAREVETLRAEAAALGAATRADQALAGSASLSADGTVLVRAPRAGRLLQRASGHGRIIQAGGLLARIGQRDERVVTGRAPARLAGTLAPGMRATVGGAVGELDSVAGAIDTDSRSLTVSARMPAGAGLPGALVELAIDRAAPAGARRVPVNAVVALAAGDAVFTRRGETITMTPVQVHYRDGSYAWVGGLPAGSEVVVRGVLALKAVAGSLPAAGDR
ncbi:efflux RND transporter periplasmic adaptor subunit [Luteimonas sp. MJ250]|uniref:efflux RND transporter periplasmic adaptor subunit n=1 Tax=Luteimonas sp. MJ250 TaxID=3129236 RepID=UPI0031BB274C